MNFFWFHSSELGEMLMRKFNEFNDAFYQCKWYFFSIEMQKMLLIVIANTQQPIFVQGFGNISCTRDSFKKVADVAKNDGRILLKIFHYGPLSHNLFIFDLFSHDFPLFDLIPFDLFLN